MDGEDWIPVKVRGYIYRALTLVMGLNAIFGFFSGDVATKIVQVAALFGFGLASVHTPTKPPR